jgi:glycine hydroxymethyltransferase
MWSSYLQELILKEYTRQQNSLELIASENYTSKEVISAYSNIFTNKYSEGYPWKRYYGGNEVVDELELYTQWLALDIFWLDHALRWVNVQPLSWSVANLAVYTGLLNPWDTILAMDLNAWWHLTHGMKLNASGKYFTIVHYGTNKEWVIDYDQLHALTIQHQPKIIVAWFSSYPRNIDWEKFIECKKILAIKGISCYLMADIAHIAGLIAWWTLSSPFEAGFDIITTTTHKTLRWPRWALIYYSLKEWKELELQINRWVFPGVQWWPFDHVLVAKAQAFSEIIDPSTKRSEYSKKTLSHAKLLAQELLNRWWVLTTWW